MAYANLEPFGDERADLRAAIISCTMANAWRGEGQTAYKPVDFMPFTEKPAQSWQGQLAMVKMLHEALGGRTRG